MKARYYTCECKCGVLCAQYEPDWGLEISMFQRNPSRSLWNRIRIAWSALRGVPYTDMVVLNDQQIASLIDQLVEIQDRERYNTRTTVHDIVNNLHEYDSKQVIDAILEYLKRTKSNTHTQNLISEITPLKY